jgi:hypothetical protein
MTTLALPRQQNGYWLLKWSDWSRLASSEKHTSAFEWRAHCQERDTTYTTYGWLLRHVQKAVRFFCCPVHVGAVHACHAYTLAELSLESSEGWYEEGSGECPSECFGLFSVQLSNKSSGILDI